MSNKISMRGAWARQILQNELEKEISIHQSRGVKFNESSSINIPTPSRGSSRSPSPSPGWRRPNTLLPDYSQIEEVSAIDPKTNLRAIPPLPVWPALKICIVGAGISGLYTAMILDSLNIPNLTYDILESSDRVGGRLFTHQFDEEEHQYYDVGAGRYPRLKMMNRCFDLFRRIVIEDSFVKYYLNEVDGAINNPQYFNDRLHVQKKGAKAQVDPLKFSKKNKGVVPDVHVEMGPDAIFEEVYAPFKDALEKDWSSGFDELMRVDSVSTRGYIREKSDFSDYATTQWLQTVHVRPGFYDQAFSETIVDTFDFDVPVIEAWTGMKERWICVSGGSSVIINGMLASLSTQPQLSKRVTSISIERNRISPAHNNMRVLIAGEKEARYYSTVFSSTTFGAAQRMDLSKAELHPVQMDAIRSLKYDACCKVSVRFKTAWWIKGGIRFGGSAKTDSAIRTCIYPSYNIRDDPDCPAVLLCSYTWAQDAQRMGTLISAWKSGQSEELKEVVLKDLAKLHSNFGMTVERLESEFLEMHAWDWYADPNYSGAFALFGPGQFKNLYPIMTRPTADGNLHFIGEATSSHHAWVVGALNSAYRGVFNFLKKYQMEKGPMRRHWQKKIDELKEKWGTIDELDTGINGTAHLSVMLGRLRPEEHVQVEF